MTTTESEATPALKLRSGYEYSNEGRDPNPPHPGWTEKDVNEEIQTKLLGALKEAREKTTQTAAAVQELKEAKIIMRDEEKIKLNWRIEWDILFFRALLSFGAWFMWFFYGIVPKFSLLIFLPISIWFSINPNLWMLVFFAEMTIRILSDEYPGPVLTKGAQNAVVSQDTVRKYDGL